jgi:glycosyltransferase involved in cell wall biosynthesis
VRVALISEHANPLAALGSSEAGGQNVHVGALGVALAAAGHQVEIFSRRESPDQPDAVILAPGVQVVHVPAGPPAPVPRDDLLPLMPQFGAWLRHRWSTGPAPDIVHAHFWMSGVAAMPVCRRLGLPFVQTFHALGSVKHRHQGSADTSPPGRQALEQKLARGAGTVIATCSDEVDELGLMGVGDARIRVVPCGVDLALFSPDGPAWPRPANDRHRIVCLSRLVERKGIDTVVAAMTGIRNAELLIAGGPPADRLSLDPDVRRLLHRSVAWGVQDRVHLLGRVGRADVPALLRSADVLVTVPVYEPFGIVPLEAMACGIPVVASAVGGMLDTVVGGVTGVHVPPGDIERLAKEVSWLLADPSRRRSLGDAGAVAARRYSWQRVAAETADVYAALCHPGSFAVTEPASTGHAMDGQAAGHASPAPAATGHAAVGHAAAGWTVAGHAPAGHAPAGHAPGWRSVAGIGRAAAGSWPQAGSWTRGRLGWSGGGGVAR